MIKELISNTRRMFGIIWHEKKGVFIILSISLIGVAMGPFLQSGAIAFLINALVKLFESPGDVVSALTPAIVLLILAELVPSLSALVQGYYDRRFWFFLQEKFELWILRKRGEVDIATYEDPKKNDLFQRVNEEGIWRAYNFAERQLFIFQNIFEIVAAGIILITTKWWVLAIVIGSAVPQLILEARHGDRVWGIFAARSELKRRYFSNKHHFEHLPSLIELKLFQNLQHFYEIIKTLLTGFHADELQNERRRMKNEFFAFAISQIGIITAVTWLVFTTVKGETQIGTLTFFLASIASLRRALSGFFLNLGKQYQDNHFISDVFKVIDFKPTMEVSKEKIVIRTDRAPEIKFENVSFAYPGATKEQLKNFSLTIASGEKIALVGKNGAGKTTFVKLLCRFYDPTSGRILIDGHDLKDINLESWYSMLGALFQDYANYHFLAKEAIGIGRTSVPHSSENVKRSAEASEADVFIGEWEHAYEQMLGKQFTEGIEPSIGQWQKLALARTFYRDPYVFILDEPTSSIDAEAEAKIFDRLESLSKEHSVILISHRFSTVRHADRICVIEDGEMSELGTHEELLRKDGIYARLFKLQAKGYQ